MVLFATKIEFDALTAGFILFLKMNIILIGSFRVGLENRN